MKWITKIIGAAIIVTATILYSLKLGGVLLGIAGLIILLAPTKHATESLKKIKKTINWKILTTAIFEALYWLIIIVITTLYFKILGNKIAKMPNITPETILNPSTTQTAATSIQGIYYHLIIGSITILVLTFLVYIITRTIIWKIITKQKINKKFILKYLATNAINWIIWLIPVAIFAMASATTKTRGPIILILMAATYFCGILHPMFMKKQKIGYTISHTIATGITQIHKYIVPYTYALLIYGIIIQPIKLIPIIATPLSIVTIILFISWLRIYINEITKEII